MFALPKFLTQLIVKLAFPLLLFLAGVYAWNYAQHQERLKTATVYFQNVDGLSRGAPVFVGGTVVGKVKDIYPIVNDNKVAVDILITKEDFPTPQQGTKASIQTNISRGGGRVVALKDVQVKSQKQQNIEPLTSDYLTRLAMDMFQMGKDFASQTVQFMNDPKTHAYKDKIQSQLNYLKTSIEKGTVKEDLQQEINKLNKTIQELESGEKEFLKDSDKQALINKLEATKNTLKTLGSMTDNYKHAEEYRSQELDI